MAFIVTDLSDAEFQNVNKQESAINLWTDDQYWTTNVASQLRQGFTSAFCRLLAGEYALENASARI
jgi:hypothetical protein